MVFGCPRKTEIRLPLLSAVRRTSVSPAARLRAAPHLGRVQGFMSSIYLTVTVGSRKLECGFTSSPGFRVGGQSYSNLLASTVLG